MKDIKDKEIYKGNTLQDCDGRQYKVIESNGELYAKSLFNDYGGCGKYILYQERIERNRFQIIE